MNALGIVTLVAGSSVLAAVVTKGVDLWGDGRKRRVEADFAALYLAIALEDYAAKCSGIIADIGNHLRSLYDNLREALQSLKAKAASGEIESTSFGQARTLSIFGCKLVASGNWHWVVYDPFSGRLYDPLEKQTLRLPIRQLNRLYRPFSRIRVRQRACFLPPWANPNR